MYRYIIYSHSNVHRSMHEYECSWPIVHDTSIIIMLNSNKVKPRTSVSNNGESLHYVTYIDGTGRYRSVSFDSGSDSGPRINFPALRKFWGYSALCSTVSYDLQE